ncbi:ABC transporter ATP-binding protein [Agrococcus carbonis]|uniref:Amino acid/amide ABC transporter ATP-binding protein 1, HAAT family n=1 Tax=Agrococcus carbonis TaxID=684552 RepID=A0A1H1RW19_9MICO|nr:ABC transporter ATP-binding protein [Agrococcus carbonis]SDS39981.1 amino acid/amide ABC transporter ATP-binding protein 1, HAAT family [Agrococcus carbonis]
MADRPALVLDSVDLQIGGARILHDVSFEVATGEMVGVIGPNGAGKTTLFNIISGVMIPTGGRVLLQGDDVTSRKVYQRARVGLGRTFQTSSVFAGLTATENVRQAAQAKLGGAVSPWLFPRAADEAHEVAARCLAEVDLAHHAQTEAGVLSHGDKRKLEIAMLLATEPRVVLLDEPMAGVGSGDVAGLVEVIRRLHESGRTVLMVEHHMEVLLGLVDRVAVMHHGELLAIDTPKAVMADPDVQKAYLGETV